MTVGGQASVATVDNALTTLAVSMRNVCQQVLNMNQWINGQNNGIAYLESLGYSAADAATAEQLIGYLTTMAQVFNGTATQAAPFNFSNALAQVYAGQ